MSEAAFIGAIVLFIIYLLVVTLFLKIALNIIGAKKTDFGEVFITALICAIIAAIFTFLGASPIGILFIIIGVIIIIYFIGQRHDIGFCLAIIVVIVALVVFIIVYIIVVAILGLFGIVLSIFV